MGCRVTPARFRDTPGTQLRGTRSPSLCRLRSTRPGSRTSLVRVPAPSLVPSSSAASVFFPCFSVYSVVCLDAQVAEVAELLVELLHLGLTQLHVHRRFQVLRP